MCGICGVAYRDAYERVDPRVVHRMCETIRHRGPDDHGRYIAGPIGLGMRRLSIIDVERGHQPVCNESADVHAVCNGEIYNYRVLATALREGGHRLRSDSDVEVIPHVYEEAAIRSDCGAQFLSRLQGMFALAVWDERRRTMLLAVDRFGIKPLYYTICPAGLVFGSELKCLLASGMIGRELDLDALAEYFTLGYIPAPRTIFRSVRKLAPAHLLQWSADHGPVLEQYWHPPRGAPEPALRPPEARHVLREALRDSVRSHLVSDVPLGAFLSGGIDSSVVVALMSEVSSAPVKTFSIGFSDRRFSELPKARLVAQRFGTEHHELIVEPADAGLLRELVSHFDEPFADPSALPTYYVSRLARETVKVALSGDGGDELFVGYTMFQGLELARLGQRLPGPLRGGLRSLAGAVPSTGSADIDDTLRRWRGRLADSLTPPGSAHRNKLASPGLELAAPCLSSQLRESLAACNPYAAIDAALDQVSLAEPGHPLDPYLHAALTVTLPGDMLTKVDRMSMANSLEVRVPLLDHRLFEVVASIPVKQRFRRGRLKGMLRDCMADVLPDQIIGQDKRGFNLPLAAWLRGDLQGLAREVLISPEARDRGLLDVAAIERRIGQHALGHQNLSSTIWSLLVFELWCRQHLDS